MAHHSSLNLHDSKAPSFAKLGIVNLKNQDPAPPPQYDAKDGSSEVKDGHKPQGNGRWTLVTDADYLLLKLVILISAIGGLLAVAFTVLAKTPRPLEPSHGLGRVVAEATAFLDHEEPISGFAGQTFLRDEVPFIDIPDKLIEDVYYYRWTSLQRNLRYVKPGIGYMCTEFVTPVWYAKAFGTIDAAAGHQIDESRWLRSNYYADDYIQLYTRGPADPKQYTQWILDAMNRRASVTGDYRFLSTQLDDMVRVWHLWDDVFDPDVGLYFYQPVWDAQELSLPGFIADPNNENFTLRRDGPDTFRPSHNAYMVANARAIAKAAGLAHDGFLEFEFTKIADELEAAMYKRLWAPEQQFFMDVIRPDNPELERLTGREQVGLFPYRFGIGLNKTYAQPAVDALFDPTVFLSRFGPTTLELTNEWFMWRRPNEFCCYWNGMSWPFSTGHTLKSLATIYRAGITDVTAEQYHDYLHIYARTQQKDDMPYVAESHWPFEDSWSADSYNHSEHYDHSTYTDDVITGLFGILPQADNTLHVFPIVPENWTYFAIENLPYHGHLVTILYDRDGSRYNVASGLSIYVDGVRVHNGADKIAVVAVPPPILPDEPLVNIASNPTGPGQYPLANATYTYFADYYYQAIDGVVYYDHVPNNRWTNSHSPNMNDTLTVTFARPRNISSVTLALFSDVARGGNIDLPARIEVYGTNGLITASDYSTQLLENDRNHITFKTVETDSIAVNLYRKSGTVYVGICELEVWQPAEPGPTYYAVDAHLMGEETRVVFDNSSTATGNGAVVGGLRSDSEIAFSGIVSKGESTTLTLSYSNVGNVTAKMTVNVNQVPQAKLELLPSKGKYVDVATNITLAVGKNYVSLVGGSEAVNITVETVTIL